MLGTCSASSSNLYRNNEHVAAQIYIDPGLAESELHSSLKKVAREIIGETAWREAADSDIDAFPLTGGLSNLTYCLHLRALNQKVVVRVFGAGSEKFIDRDIENVVCCTLSKAGLAALFYGRFLNGRVEGFLDATNLTPTDMMKEDIFPEVAALASRIHSMNIPGIAKSESYLWDKTECFLSLAEKVQFSPSESRKQKSLDKLNIVRLRNRYESLKSYICKRKNDVQGSFSKASAAMAKLAGRMVASEMDDHTRHTDGSTSSTVESNSGCDRITTGNPNNLIVKAGMEFGFQVCFCHGDMFSSNIMLSNAFKDKQNSSPPVSYGNGNAEAGRSSAGHTAGNPLDQFSLVPATLGISSLSPASGTETTVESAMKTSPLTLIDYEYSTYSFRGHEFAHHFMEYCGFDVDLSKFPPEKFRLKMLGCYLRNVSALPVPAVTEPLSSNEDFVKGFDKVVRMFVLVMNIFWSAWSVIQAESAVSIDFDYLEYAQLRYNAYESLSKQFGELLCE